MNPAAIPTQVIDLQGDERWLSMHARFIAEAKDREPEVVFVGDSIMQQLALTDIWKKLFVPLHCLNFGIGGDQTQHVLWRLTNGELEHISPKVVALMVGTNNHEHTAEQVVGGILEIIKTITDLQPQAQIVVMGLLPRGQYHNPLREKIAKINAMLSEKIPHMPNAQFLNVEPSLFVSSLDGSISHSDMYDYLHLTRDGYQKVAELLLEEVETLLKNFMTADNLSTGDPEN